MKKTVIDAMGQACPIPVVRASRAVQELGGAGEVEIRVDNEAAVQNLLRMAEGFHAGSTWEQLGEKAYVVHVTTEGAIAPAETPEPVCPAERPAAGPLVVAVDTQFMGRGSEDLGATLMKGFLYALGQLPQLPETMLFYNGGAFLTTAGSASLEDLRALEERGVKILTCGTCLNYYGLSEKLEVGGVTNMYDIVQTLAAAGSVIKP